MKKVYLSGAITSDPNYREKFEDMAIELTGKGYKVMNPTVLPEGFDYRDYMHICTAMVMVCDAIYLLPCWEQSTGAKMEKQLAEAMGKEVMYAS